MEQGMQKFDTADACLHYSVLGEGKPVLLIPGSISDYRTWRYQVEEFSKAFKVILISRRYQYPASYIKGGESTIKNNTEDITALLKHLNIEKVNLVGHSYGGYIAIDIAARYPELTDKLILEEPFFTPALIRGIYNPFQYFSLYCADKKAYKNFTDFVFKNSLPAMKAIKRNDIEKAKTVFIKGLYYNFKTYGEIDELTKLQADANMANFIGDNPFVHKFSLKNTSSILSRTLLIGGDRSPYIFSYINQCLEKNIPVNQRIVIDNAGHWVHSDQREKFNSEVINFLKEN